MDLQHIQQLYGATSQARAFANAVNDETVRSIFLQGLVGSSVPMFFAGLTAMLNRTVLFVLQDTDEAGYFYHDLTQVMGQEQVLFFPSSFRRAVKYGQRDAANEILRTEVLTRISSSTMPMYIVTSPEALSELVVSKKQLDERRLSLKVGQTIRVTELTHKLLALGFSETDYVYEPGQFALRGSILDVYSFSGELPYRIDFFGDEIDTIRTFTVQDQLSKDKMTAVEIVPELVGLSTEKVSFFRFLPANTLLAIKDMLYVRDSIAQIYDEGFSSQVIIERMEEDIDIARELGVDGIVLGCLTPEGSIDLDVNARLMEHTHGMSTTFHRAFDCCKDPSAALEQLIGLGFDRVLTSGQQPTAEQGIPLLTALHIQSAGRITLLAGCGVNEGNIRSISEATDIREFHFSARVKVPGAMLFSNPKVYMGARGVDENVREITSSERVKNTIAQLL